MLIFTIYATTLLKACEKTIENLILTMKLFNNFLRDNQSVASQTGGDEHSVHSGDTTELFNNFLRDN